MAVTITELATSTFRLHSTSGGSHIYTTVDADSSGTTLNVAATTGFEVGMVLIIHPGGAREEKVTIASITAGVSVTIEETALEFTHTAAQADPVSVEWFYVVQPRNHNTVFSIGSLNQFSKFSTEESFIPDATNKTALIFIDPGEDSGWLGSAVGRSWISGDYTSRPDGNWYYSTTSLQATPDQIPRTTVEMQSASGQADLFVQDGGAPSGDWASGTHVLVDFNGVNEELKQSSSRSAADTTVSSSSTGTTLNVTSESGFSANDWITVDRSGSGSGPEQVQIQSVAVGVLTLVGPGLTGTYTNETVDMEKITLTTNLSNTHAANAIVVAAIGVDDFNDT